MIVTEARKQPQQDHAPATIDHDAKIPTRKDRQSLTVTPCEKVVHRPKVNRCPDVVNYPATPTFSISAYKIYAVHRMKKYKSNSRSNQCRLTDIPVLTRGKIPGRSMLRAGGGLPFDTGCDGSRW
jgi:hypothetical protein